MGDRPTKSGYLSGDAPVSALGPLPEVLTRPAAQTDCRPSPVDLLRAEADRLDRDGIWRKWGLLDADGRLTDEPNGRFVALEPDQFRFAAELLRQLRDNSLTSTGG